MKVMVTQQKQQLYDAFSARLNEACDDLGWPKTGRNNRVMMLIEAIPFKVSRNGARKWFYGESMPDVSKIGYVADAIGVNLNWLSAGKGSKHTITGVGNVVAENATVYTTPDEIKLASFQPAINVTTEKDSNFVAIKQYRSISLSAGAGSNIDTEKHESLMYFKKSWMNYKGLNEKTCVVVYARGESMSPAINDGSVVLVNTEEKNIIDGKFYALNYSDQARIKLLYKQIDGSVLIKSINPDPSYADEILKPDELEYLHIIGRVVWVGNEL